MDRVSSNIIINDIKAIQEFTSECCDANSTTALVENEYLDPDGFEITMIGTCELCGEIRNFLPLEEAK